MIAKPSLKVTQEANFLQVPALMAHFGQNFTCAQARPKAGADCVGGFSLVESYHSDTSVV